MAHLFLNDGITSAFAHTVHYLVVGQYRTEFRTPVHHRFAQIGDAVIHERLLLFLFVHGFPFVGSEPQFLATSHVQAFRTIFIKCLHQFFNRACLLPVIAIITVEHLLESPLRPMVIGRVASTYFPIPVEAKTNLVQLFTVAVDIGSRGNGRVLPRLYGILLGRKSVSIVSHGIQHVKSLQTFVTCVNIRSNVT